MSYIFDTDICVQIINKNPTVLKKLRHLPKDKLFITTITEGELWFGVRNSSNYLQNMKMLEKFLAYFQKLDFTSRDARSYSSVRFELQKKGKIIGNNDLLIASQVLERDGILVTGNEREFRRIKDLKVENWLK